jgi:hypothetical protein
MERERNPGKAPQLNPPAPEGRNEPPAGLIRHLYDCPGTALPRRFLPPGEAVQSLEKRETSCSFLRRERFFETHRNLTTELLFE